jgi:hypothetical protein
MKSSAAYIATLILLVCASFAEIKANSHFIAAKKRIAEITANLPKPADYSELIRDDEVRTEHILNGQTWAKPGLMLAGLGFVTFVLAIIRREKGWYSIPVLLMVIYFMLTTSS